MRSDRRNSFASLTLKHSIKRFEVLLRVLTMRISDVPVYLRGGLFYQSLDKEDKGAFEVPEGCTKNDPSVESLEDLTELLRTVQFWGLPGVPVEVIKFMLRNGEIDDYECVLAEFPEMFKILLVKNIQSPYAICAAIQLQLGVNMVQLLHNMQYPTTVLSCKAAALMGDLESLMYLHTEGCPWDEETTNAAVENNHFDCLQYALDYKCPTSADIFNEAVGFGNINILQCLMSHGFSWNERTFWFVVAGRKLGSARFLVEAGYDIPSDACVAAAFIGDDAILAYFHECGQELTIENSLCAATIGHLSCLVYLHQQGCPWDELCLEKAAFGGHLECLKYLHENGCPWDYRASTAALAGGSWTCLCYIARNGDNCQVPLLLMGCVAVLIYSMGVACCRDRSWSVCAASYYIDVMFILDSFCCVLIVVHTFGKSYYKKYMSLKTRSGVMIGFLLTGVYVTVNCIYSLCKCFVVQLITKLLFN